MKDQNNQSEAFIKCPYCYSDIPKQALKCKYCQEWVSTQEDVFFQQNLKNEKKSPQHIAPDIKPFQSFVNKILPFNYVTNVMLCSSLLFTVIAFIHLQISDENIYLISFGLYAIQMAFSWAGLLWFHKLYKNFYGPFINLVEREEDEVHEIYVTYFRNIFNNPRAIAMGIVIGLIGGLGDLFLVGTPFSHEIMQYTYGIFVCIVLFWSGAAIYSILNFAIFVNNLGKLPLSNDYKYNENTGLANLGKIHIKTSLLAIVPFALGIAARLIGNWDLGILTLLFYGFFAVIIFLFLLWPLNNIHQLMLFDKKTQLNKVQSQLNKVMNVVTHNPSSPNMRRYFELRELERTIKKKNTWPFETMDLTGAFAAVILPIIITIIEIVYG